MTRIEIRESHLGEPGIFTVEHLLADQVVFPFRLGREVTPETPLRSELDEFAEHCSLIDNRVFLIPSPQRYLNHSCDPNVFLRYDDMRVDVVARREIQARDELTIDYLINNQGGNSWPCRCTAERCRGETGSSFFAIPEAFQREYLPLLAPWFLKQYSEELKVLRR